MHKKLLIVAVLVVAAAAFAIPSVASASSWKKHTVNAVANENVTLTLTNFGYVGEYGGVKCTNVHSNSELTPGSTGHVKSFTVASAPTECSTSGPMAGCTVTSVESTTPWIMHNTTTNIHITNVKIHTSWHGAFCPYSKTTLKGELTIMPTNTTYVGSGTISSTNMDLYNGVSTATISQTFVSAEVHIIPAGTYGLQ